MIKVFVRKTHRWRGRRFVTKKLDILTSFTVTASNAIREEIDRKVLELMCAPEINYDLHVEDVLTEQYINSIK